MTNTESQSEAARRGGSYEDGLANGHALVADHPAVALDQARTLLRVAPDPRAHRLAAAALRRLDRGAEAEGDELNAIRLGLADPALNDAAALLADGKADQARTRVEQLIASRGGDDLLARTLAAEAALAIWDLAAAERHIRFVLERAPSFLRAAMLLATCLARQARIREAVEHLGRVSAVKPDNRPVLAFRGQLAAEAGDAEQAAAAYQRLVELDPADADSWVHLAQHRRILGNSAGAIDAFRRTLALDPVHGSAWWGLAHYYPDALPRDAERMLRDALAANGDGAGRGALNLALATLLDRSGDHSAAFERFVEGKAARLALQPFDPAAASAAIDRTISALTPERMAAAKGETGEPAIFILGMPRSGSTLVMRILGGHPDIEDAGELPILPRLAEHLRFALAGGGDYGALVEAMTAADAARLGERYLERAAGYRATAKPRFIDKLNLNWLHAGLIRMALPAARIIDVRRDPIDCCWANFKMLFAAGHPAANDLTHIGRFYRDYVRMIDAVDAAAPGAVLRVRYEDVVDDLETETRRMLDFLGLKFDRACLDFQRGGAVATASSEQVRRPLNRSGIGSADPYRPWLGPLIEALEPLADQ